MFNFGKSPDYQAEVKKLLAAKKLSEIEKVARKAYQDPKVSEDTLAWLAGAIYEMKITSALDLLEVYVERYPKSLHMIRVYFADLLSRLDRNDETTNHARIYLRQVQDNGLFPKLATEPLRMVQEATSRAFLLLTAVYTTVGARSYSKRILDYGLKFPLLPTWVPKLQREIDNLNTELEESTNAAMDLKWEQFFSTGDHADELHDLCTKTGCLNLAKRIDLIDGQFRFGAGDHVRGEQEILMLIFHPQSDNSFILG